MIVDGVEFVEEWTWSVSTPERFSVMKPAALIEAYLDLLARHEGGRMVELGVLDGGSAALMALVGRPSKMVAVDLLVEAPALVALAEARGLPVATFFGVDQGDTERLSAIMAAEFDGPLDLVVDDASHRYAPTRASFEVLFPLLRSGGQYVIEDWRSDDQIASAVRRRWEVGDTANLRVTEQVLLNAVVADPNGEVARQVAEAEQAGELSPEQQTRLELARRAGLATTAQPDGATVSHRAGAGDRARPGPGRRDRRGAHRRLLGGHHEGLGRASGLAEIAERLHGDAR